MEINISAIVPVYGVEKYLPRCLRSLEEQTIFERVEVILIDDGSPDRCGELCDAFAARHPQNGARHPQGERRRVLGAQRRAG